jgi:hypothetical protein
LCLETLLACFASKLAHSAPGANLRTDSDQGGGEGQAEELGPIHRGRKGRGLHENAAAGDFGCEQGHVGFARRNYSNARAANDLADRKALIMATAAIRSAASVAASSMPNCLIWVLRSKDPPGLETLQAGWDPAH